MVASPEICRKNGARSRGPKTDKGKAIAARNATKHGILAQTPPLLDTEDLESFQSMIQSLIDEHQPKTPIEHMLIQQIAMGWLRLHRLWGVEAATANIQILQAQRDRMNVYRPKKVDDSISAIVREHKEKSLKQSIEKEKRDIHLIINKLTNLLSLKPKEDAEIAKWFYDIQDAIFLSLDCERPAHAESEDLNNDFWSHRSLILEAMEDIDDTCPAYEIPSRLSDLSPQLVALGLAAEKRFNQIQALEDKIKELEDAIAEARMNAKGLQDPELFARYERHITKQIDNACDRLQKIQEQRKNRHSMGSFG